MIWLWRSEEGADDVCMDIAALSTELSQAKLSQQVSVAVLKRGQDVAKQQGEAAVALLQSAAQMQKGLNQASGAAAAATGAGGTIDVRG